jgi:predicted ATP-grasp superfamily ATP-dependent carboligase
MSECRWYYFQEFVEGLSCSALFVGGQTSVAFLGLTRQLVGEPWLHARQFQYCGSIGPLQATADLQNHFNQLGDTLIKGSRWTTLEALMESPLNCVLQTYRQGGGLRGLFGVDCILRDGIPWPIEINPRYTASVEVLEYGAGIPTIALHRTVFDPTAPVPEVRPRSTGIVGKAILFAKDSLDFPIDGPWMPTLRSPGPIEEMPAFADIPHPGERIEARHPILTFFARAESEASCLEQLKSIAADLDRWLFKA